MVVSLRSDIFLRVAEAPGSISDIWFIHGFGESGLSFHEAFSSPLASAYNLYTPDLPGSGVSPPDPRVRSIASAAAVLVSLLGKLSGAKPVILVGHSLGSLIAVDAAHRLGSRVAFLASIEGNLTDEDITLSGLTKKYKTPEDFYPALTERIAGLSDDREALLRYRASLRLADPETLWNLGRSGVVATGTDRGAENFRAVTCCKAYYWGEKSLSLKSRDLLKDWPVTIRTQGFPDVGHWPMITTAKRFYAKLAEDIAAACNG